MIQRKKGQEPNLPPDEKAQNKAPWAMLRIASTGRGGRDRIRTCDIRRVKPALYR